MELKEAILVAIKEWTEETRAWDGPPNEREDAEISQSGIPKKIVGETPFLEFASNQAGIGRLIEMAISLAIRFGMRVQRKLDHPERVTTYQHTGGGFSEEQLDEIRRLFLAAWEGTSDHLNLVALRLALGLDKLVPLPVDTDLTPMLAEMAKEQDNG